MLANLVSNESNVKQVVADAKALAVYEAGGGYRGLRKALKETGIIAASLVAAGFAGLAVGRWFSLYSAAVLVFVFGIASGVAKVAFDSIIQSELPEGARGWAFARSESVLQLAWVGGAIAPLVIAIPSGPGVFAAGVTAQVLALIYVAGRGRTAGASGLP